MTIEELVRSCRVQTADNGLVFATLTDGKGEADQEDGGGAPAAGLVDRAALENLAKMGATVPRTLVPRLGRSATYFVPFLFKHRRTVAVATQAAAEGETRKELCHHLDVKPQGNLLLVSLGFYENDSFGLAMEFFDKIAYLATLETDARPDFDQLLRQQLEPSSKPGELTPETWEWRQELKDARAPEEAWLNYRRAAEADALGLYMASLFTDIFYEDLFEPEPGFAVLAPDLVYERVRMAERLYPANRGYSLQIVRQRPRRRRTGTA